MGIELKRTSGLPAEGTQLYKITASEEKDSSEGNPMWVVTAQCQTAGEDQGKQTTNFFPLSDAARFKMEELLDAVKAPKTGRWEAPQLVGKSLRIAIQHVEYQGSKRANWFHMFPADSTDDPTIPPGISQDKKKTATRSNGPAVAF